MKTIKIIVLLFTFFVISCDNIEDANKSGNLVPKTVEEDSSLPSITLNNVKFHCQTYGNPQNPLLVILHGGPGGDYRSLLKYQEFANDGYFVVFWDQRGSGLSQRVDKAEITEAAYLSDLEKLVNHFAPSDSVKVSFIAHSWGAMYATMYINKHPDKVDKSVLSEPGGFNSEELNDFIEKSQSINLFDEKQNDVLRSDETFSNEAHAKIDFKRALIVENFTTHEQNDPRNPAPRWRYGGIAGIYLLKNTENFNWTTNLQYHQNKVLFLRGNLNLVANYEHQLKLAKHFPKYEIATINGAGHYVLYEKYNEARRIILNYFKGE